MDVGGDGDLREDDGSSLRAEKESQRLYSDCSCGKRLALHIFCPKLRRKASRCLLTPALPDQN